jgi:hypothetical protein
VRAAREADENRYDPDVPGSGIFESGGNNRGKWVEMYQQMVGISPGDPWCAAYVYARLKLAAQLLGRSLPAGFPRSGYTPTYKQWAQDRGLWIPVSAVKAGSAQPAAGDLACFYFASKGRIAHIGVVVRPYAAGSGQVVTVEGNTGPDSPDGVNRDGDGVYLRHRPLAALGRHGGFCRLNF